VVARLLGRDRFIDGRVACRPASAQVRQGITVSVLLVAVVRREPLLVGAVAVVLGTAVASR
jgi:hypothetical protein